MKKILLIFITLLGCITEDTTPPCIGGCSASVYMFYPKDNNGFYHIKDKYFSIYFEASPVESNYKYNGVSVIEGWVNVDKSRIYLKEYSSRDEFEPKDDFLWGKKILINVQPDTISVNPRILWEAGSKTTSVDLNELKIILE